MTEITRPIYKGPRSPEDKSWMKSATWWVVLGHEFRQPCKTKEDAEREAVSLVESYKIMKGNDSSISIPEILVVEVVSRYGGNHD